MKNNQKIGLFPLISLVTGNLVGSGVYLLPTSLALLGSISLGGWIITSVGALSLALVFAGLSSHTFASGGPYQFARTAFGDTIAYFVCWSYWMLSWISNPALAVAAVGALSAFMGPFTSLETLLWEGGILMGLSLFNLLGIGITGRFEFYITLIKLVPLVILPLVGLFVCDFSHFPALNLTNLPTHKALSSAALLTMWAFIGLETGTVPAGQVENPQRTIPIATIAGTLIAAVIYILGTVVIFGVVPEKVLINSAAPYADAAHYIFGGNWLVAVAVAITITCLGTLNGWIMVVARIPYGAAKDGLFPQSFMRTNRHGTPYWGVLIASFCSIPLLFTSLESSLLAQFNMLIDVAVTQILVVYLVCVAAYFVILKRQGRLGPKALCIGGVALLYSGWALLSVSGEMVLYSCGILVGGVPMWAILKYKKRK